MTTNIRMYDCGFGDCFRISHGDEHLYVDFGTHWSYPPQDVTKVDRYKQITDDMPRSFDFLLSHYHYDHYSGALHMGYNKQKKFHKVYIPDIWTGRKSVPAINCILMFYLFSKAALTNNLTLFDLLKKICDRSGRIYLVSRGTPIEKDYIALWPEKDMVESNAALLWSKLKTKIPFAQKLDEISCELRDIVLRMVDQRDEASLENYKSDLENLKEKFLSLAHQLPVGRRMPANLKDFVHEANIVFHNKAYIKKQNADSKIRNILFTGDADPRLKFGDKNENVWDFIKNNRDGKGTFHENYDVIKIPHHGTNAYHVDLAKYCSIENAMFLIPNGKRKPNPASKTANNPDGWGISAQYSTDANSHTCKVFCSNNQSCGAVNPNCSCNSKEIIFSSPTNFYIDIK